jgi:hypothetical protein
MLLAYQFLGLTMAVFRARQYPGQAGFCRTANPFSLPARQIPVKVLSRSFFYRFVLVIYSQGRAPFCAGIFIKAVCESL